MVADASKYSSFRRPKHIELDKGLKWTGLKVLRTEAGENGDLAGTVEFEATYVLDGKKCVLREMSQFRFEGGRWFYLGEEE